MINIYFLLKVLSLTLYVICHLYVTGKRFGSNKYVLYGHKKSRFFYNKTTVLYPFSEIVNHDHMDYEHIRVSSNAGKIQQKKKMRKKKKHFFIKYWCQASEVRIIITVSHIKYSLWSKVNPINNTLRYIRTPSYHNVILYSPVPIQPIIRTHTYKYILIHTFICISVQWTHTEKYSQNTLVQLTSENIISDNNNHYTHGLIKRDFQDRN